VLLLIPVFARHRPGLRTISLALLSPPVTSLLLADGWPSALVPAAILGMVLYAAFLVPASARSVLVFSIPCNVANHTPPHPLFEQ